MQDPDVRRAIRASKVSHVEFKAALLLVLMAVLVLASAGYLLYARGVFEPTRTVVLVADDSEGVTVGMDVFRLSHRARAPN
jgi:phospholipid/cholesterol/gamma-HCH transport system substrate-binding protein